MGTSTLETAYLNGQIIDASHINELTQALLLAFVGRDATGAAAAGQSLGNVTFPWGDIWGGLLTVDEIQNITLLGNYIQAIEQDATSTGTAIELVHPEKSVIRLTNASLVSIAMIDSPVDGKGLMIINDTTVAVTLLNNSGATTANRILTGTGSNLSVASGACVILIYEASSARWRIIGGSGGGGGISAWVTATAYVAGNIVHTDNKIYKCLIGHTSGTFATDLAAANWQSLSVGDVKIFGSKAAPIAVDATGITFVSTYYENIMFIESTVGAIDVTTDPQITAPTLVGQKLKLVGCNATKTVQLDDLNGLSLRGSWLSDLGNVLNLYADSALLWCEDNRSL